MNDQPRLSIWDRSPIVRAIRGLLTWRDIRRELIILAWTATIIALLYGLENWYGRHVWNKYRHALEARGEQLDFKAFIPPPVPDDQNFAATPLIKSWFVRESSAGNKLGWAEDNYSQVQGKIGFLKTKGDGGNRHFEDLVACGMAFDAVRSGNMKSYQRFESDKLDLESRAKAAPSVLEGLKTDDAVFAELRVASQRPYSRYPIEYSLDNPWAILLPHVQNIRAACGRLQLGAFAELALGQSANALEDVKLMLHLADSVKDEPILFSYLWRLSWLQRATQPVWEGLAEHAWSDAQLQELQTRLQQYNFVADLKQALDAERAAGVLTAELVRKKGLGYFMALGSVEETVFGPAVHGEFPRNRAVKAIGLLVPHGWYYQEQLNYCRLFQVELGGTFDPAKKQVSPSRIQSNGRELERAFAGRKPFGTIFIRHQVLASMLLPGLGGVARRAATAQVTADQAAIACALERFRLANGQFPEALDALVPRFITKLPNDVIGGEPYKYRRTADGQFVLYSVGWNEKDDGGMPGKTLFDETQGDWVWQYPPRQ
ncbi:MAG: hypothetical protein ABSA97_06665 [Verrucomicrobiia bacterium]